MEAGYVDLRPIVVGFKRLVWEYIAARHVCLPHISGNANEAVAVDGYSLYRD